MAECMRARRESVKRLGGRKVSATQKWEELKMADGDVGVPRGGEPRLAVVSGAEAPHSIEKPTAVSRWLG